MRVWSVQNVCPAFRYEVTTGLSHGNEDVVFSASKIRGSPFLSPLHSYSAIAVAMAIDVDHFISAMFM